MRKDWEYLFDLNIWIIKDLSKILDVKMPRFVRSSEIEGITRRKQTEY